MSSIAYNIVTEENSQCRRDNLINVTEVLIPAMENYLDTVNFDKYDKDEFSIFLEEFKQNLPFEFKLMTDSYGSNHKIPEDEVWMIIHNRPKHQCRLELKINSIFRIKKIQNLLDNE
jgi:hypothetical protein